MEKQQPTTSNYSQRIKFNPEKNSFLVQRVTRIYNYDPIRMVKLSHRPVSVKEEWLPLSVLGSMEPKKSVEIDILILKTAYDLDETFDKISAYFKQTLKINVLSDAKYKYLFLVKSANRAFINNIKSSQCTPLSISGSQDGIEKTLIGKEERISEDTAQKLISNNVAVYQKSGEGLRLIILP